MKNQKKILNDLELRRTRAMSISVPQRIAKTKRFRDIATEMGFKNTGFHSEFIYGNYRVYICFHPCVYGVTVARGKERPYFKSNQLSEEKFVSLLQGLIDESNPNPGNE